MLSGTFDTTITVNDVEINVTVEWSGTPGDPGVYSGPMEGSYPAEAPEVEIDAVYATEVDAEFEFGKLSDGDRDSIEEKALEAACEREDENPFDD